MIEILRGIGGKIINYLTSCSKLHFIELADINILT